MTVVTDHQPGYRFCNGDDWVVERDKAGAVVAVVHEANAASGGTRTRMLVDELLDRHRGSPEASAVQAILEP